MYSVSIYERMLTLVHAGGGGLWVDLSVDRLVHPTERSTFCLHLQPYRVGARCSAGLTCAQ